jgi:hypothetical protein
MPDRSDISPLSITDGKISKAAKIDPTKLAPATSGQVLIAGTDGKFRPGNLVTTSSGDTVAQGPAGPPGATGSQGATGATGATGANGTDASITEATVNAAGAVMHTDVPDSDTGFIKRTGAATYDVDNNNYYTEAEADALNTAIVEGYTSQLGTMAINLVIGLAGKSATGHDHAASEITSGTLHADRYTNTEYTAGDGISLAGTAFSVAAGTGLTQNSSGLGLNLQGVGEEAIRVDQDYLVFLDGGATGAAKKESLADLATAMAGTGLTSNSGELVVSTGTTGSTVATGDQGFDVHKYTRTITWGTPITDHVTYDTDVATVTHGLDTEFITVSVLDVSGRTTESGAKGFVDIDSICRITVVDSTKIKISWFPADSGTTSQTGYDFKLTVIG